VAQSVASTVATELMSILAFALRFQPDEPELIPHNPLSENDHLVLIAFLAVIGVVFAFEMLRTWRSTTEWRREARRRRRELR
jgi:hypothetical protein